MAESVKDQVAQVADQVGQLVEQHDSTAGEVVSLTDRLKALEGKVEQLAALVGPLADELADVRSRPWHLFADLPIMLAQVKALVAIVTDLFPHRANEMQTPANETVKRES